MKNSYDKWTEFYAKNIINQTPEKKKKQEYLMQGKHEIIHKLIHHISNKQI